MSRAATPDQPIHDLLVQRHSPYAFDPLRAVSSTDVQALLEAARWTMSSYNAQPWRYIVGEQIGTEAHSNIVQCLVDGNKPWAALAPVLMLGLVKTTFDHNGKPNVAAEHDLGAASAMMTLEATTRGLCVHQMIGIVPDKVAEFFDLPADVKPLTALAIGYYGESPELPDSYAARDQSQRQRLAVTDITL